MRRQHKGPWRIAVIAAAGALTCGMAVTSSRAAVPQAPDVVGTITQPFEELGATVPRCTPDPDKNNPQSGEVVCKPVAQAVSVLKDGRVFYFNGIEGHENMRNGSGTDLAPEMRNSNSRIMDLRTGTPQWAIPGHPDGGGKNPDIRPGAKWSDDPLGTSGVPGRKGDGLVGSTWGALGGPEHNPTNSPDDAADNDHDMFCADIVSLADGRMAVVGGSDWYDEPTLMDANKGDARHLGFVEVNGIRNVSLFNPETNDFDQIAHMKYNRWYPSAVVLADGKMLVVGGVTKLIKSTQLSNIRRSETWDPATNTWSENYVGPQSENSLPTQPRLFLAPNGKIFYGGAGQSWIPFGQAADEALWALQQFFDTQTKQWEVVGVNPLGVHDTAWSSALPMDPPYDKMTILTFGGTEGPSPGSWHAVPFSSLTTVDKSGTVTTKLTGNLNHARWFPTGTPLPDGSVIATQGAELAEPVMPGTEIPVRMIERYDPASGKWTDMQPAARDRTYHNTAILLPDARVLIGGHSPVAHFYGNQGDAGKPFPNNEKDPSFEVYSPPYLSWGPRPTITGVQSGIRWGETFDVKTPDPEAITQVVLMRMGSVQHSNDSDQRTLRLAFQRTDSGLRAVAPPDGVAAPPGYYYLFVNRADTKGRGMIPSVAQVVHIGDTSNPAPALQPFPDDAPAPVGGSANPDEDTSTGAQVSKAGAQATHQAADGATSSLATASALIPARPAGSSRSPGSLPVVPAAALTVAVVSGVRTRRFLRASRT